MAFCSNCGNEIPDGAKFCSGCGAVVGGNAPADQANNASADQANNAPADQANNVSAGQTYNIPAGNDHMNPQGGMNGMYENRPPYVDPMRLYVVDPVPTPEPAGIDKFGKFFWIPLVILTIVDFVSDPALVTILLSLVIISGAVFALSRKYKLKGFHIICIILAVICLLCGISQAKKIGLFKVPGKSEYAEIFDEDSGSETANESVNESNTVSKPAENSSTVSKPAENTNTASKPAEDSSSDTKPAAEEHKESEPANEIAPDGVDPDLKAFLDSYEEFVDEYVDFMKKYMADPTNVMGMLTEYTDMMTELADFETKLDSYNTNDMSTQDAAYYLEVTTRCTQKMLEIL